MRSAFAMFAAVVALTWGSTLAEAAGPDIVLADFEGKDYGAWKTTGGAFGPGPSQGAFQEFEGNPVVKHSGRDPRLLWYAPGKHWVMAVYDQVEKQRDIAFYTSPDLKAWTFQSRIAGFFECPDVLELSGKWVLTAASSDYMVGAFDGKKFTPETPKLTSSERS